jgi:hypothetical protein
MDKMPTEQELIEINKAHAPNWLGHTLIQRVAVQLLNDVVRGIEDKSRPVDEKTKADFNSIGRLEEIAFAKDFTTVYNAAIDIFNISLPKLPPQQTN